MAMKWFRKHNRKILVFGGALLMLAFLMPQRGGCQGGDSFKDYSLGQAFGKKIMVSEVRSASLDIDILQRLGMPTAPGASINESVIRWFLWQQKIRPQLAGLTEDIYRTRSRGTRDLRGELALHYALLKREARQMQLPMGQHALSKENIKDIASLNGVADFEQLAAKISSQDKQRLSGLEESHVINAIGDYVAVTKALELVVGKPSVFPTSEGRPGFDYTQMPSLVQPSEKQLELLFRNINEQLDVEYVSFPAWRYASKISPPTDAEILAQFEAYKNNYPGTKDNEFGFGYKQYLRLKIEYLKVDLEKVKTLLQRPSPVTVRQYYDQHKQLYVLPVEDDPDAPSETPVDPQYKPFEQVYEDLESRWLQEQAQAKAVEIIGEARRLTRTRWEQLKKEQKDTPIAPESLYPYDGEQQETLVNWLNKKFNTVAQYGHTDWIDIDQAESLPGIGVSYSRKPPIRGFSQIVAMVRQPSPGIPLEGDMPFELGQDHRVNLQDAQGNLYLFRVIGLRRDQVLDSSQILDDQQLVRKLTADLLAKRTYEYALNQARKLLPLAQKKGLQEALSNFADKKLKLRQAGLITRADSSKAAQELLIPLIDSVGKTHGQVRMNLQSVQFPSPQGSPPIPMKILQIELTNTSDKGRITALGIGLPRNLRMVSRTMQPMGASTATVALNGGEPVPAGPEGYTVRYFAGGIDAGQAGKFDLLISAQSQKLLSSSNLSKAGIEPEQSQIFLFLLPQGLPMRLIDFVRGPHSSSGDMRATDSTMVARLEIGGKTQLLRGIFPANRKDQFLRDSFDVLDSDTLVRKPAPPQEAKKKEQVDLLNLAAGIDQTTPRIPDLLTESSSGQPPCTLIELPRQKRCYVISAGKHLPLSRAQFLSSRQSLLNALIRQQHARLERVWWSSNSIRSRTGYRDPQAPQDASLTDQPPNQSSDEDSL